MAEGVGGRVDLARLGRLLRIGAGVAAAVAASMLVGPIFDSLPRPFHEPISYGIALTIAVAVVAAGRWRSYRWIGRAERLGRAASWLMASGLGRLLGLALVGAVAVWLPHYLTWPWSRDTDTFATLAIGWDRGVAPYRDVLAYNFPGHTYLHWLLGRTVGWGRTVAFYAVDAAAFVGFLRLVVVWSRRRLDGPIPGLVGAIGYAWFYLGFLYMMVAQRDCHTALLAASALMTIQVAPGRRGRLVSAALMAVAMTIRPQAILFVPAAVTAVAIEGPGGRARLGRVVAWTVGFGLMTAAGFVPVVASGLTGDFLRSIQMAAYGGPYSKATPGGMVARLVAELTNLRLIVALGSTVSIAAVGPAWLKRVARPWAVAAAGALAYAPISPVHHDYLEYPFLVVSAISTAFPVAWLLSRASLNDLARVLVVAWSVAAVVPGPPRFCLPLESLEALPDLARGVDPPRIPPGARGAYIAGPRGVSEQWTHYRQTLAHLRATTAPTTSVANFLTRFPWDTLNGPTGRPSPFRCESGICWIDWVAIDPDALFAATLEATEDSVVVWEPDQRNITASMPYPLTNAVVRRLYRPEAAFGPIEVWRRR